MNFLLTLPPSQQNSGFRKTTYFKPWWPVLFFLLASFFGGWPTQSLLGAQGTVEIYGTVPGCGDGVIQSGEGCDGANLNSRTCTTQGYSGGTLSCTVACEFNTLACTSGGGGGGGAATTPTVTTGSVTVAGLAYPRSVVTVLKDGQVATTVTAGSDARFNMSLSGLSAGSYIFSVYTDDSSGNRSALYSFPVSLSAGATANVSGVFLSPVIQVDKVEVKQGEPVKFFGLAVPASGVTITINSPAPLYFKTTAGSDGAYFYNVDTTDLERGQHTANSHAAMGGELSATSRAVAFAVGDRTVIAEPKTETEQETAQAEASDINNDNKVNLIDFSIAAYWYGRGSPPASVDLNDDGKVNLVDFSIMAYYWTG